MQKKPNVVLIHSFPTNTIIIKGLLDYLEQFYHLYPIDLPGFVPGSEPVDKVTLENYACATQTYIDRLGLKHYWVAGLSFGFLVANLCVSDKRCMGVVGVVPYINKHYLIKNALVYFLLEKAFALICKLNWHERAYRSKWLKKVLRTETTPERVSEILSTVSSFAFFETGLLLMTHDKEPEFRKKPYIFFVTRADHTIKMDKLSALLNSIESKKVIYITSSHHPDEISKAYFDAHVDRQQHESIVAYMLAYQGDILHGDQQEQ